jgi:hypothetical protein
MTCQWCRGSLWVVAARRRAGVEGEFHDELGPCPKCPEGRELELTNWPEEGFWQRLTPGLRRRRLRVSICTGWPVNR